MSKILEADWDQQYLLPASIEDWVAEDHPARFVRSFVESCDLKSLDFSIPKQSPEGGRPSYSVDLLLRVWLYGYICKIRSSRGLEIACKEQMGFIWLCGTLIQLWED